jgi:hypothetical protein
MFHDSYYELEVKAAYDILTSPVILEDAMRYVATYWIYSSEHNLTNKQRNRQAWLGQAACCWLVHATENSTKQAWSRMTDQQRDVANKVADKIISEWENEYAKKIP